MRLVEPVRAEEPRPRRPAVEVTDEEVVVVVEEEGDEVVELRSSCRLPKEPLENREESPDARIKEAFEKHSFHRLVHNEHSG